MKSPIRMILPAGAVAALLVARSAHATPDFPGVVASFVGTSVLPACTICHNNPNGGLGTATTVFGTYMRSRGVIPYDEDSLRNALAAAAAEKHDSNGDGVTDIDALKQGLDPNGTQGVPPLEYGCLGRIAKRGDGGAMQAIGAAIAIAFAGLMRRKRRAADRR